MGSKVKSVVCLTHHSLYESLIWQVQAGHSVLTIACSIYTIQVLTKILYVIKVECHVGTCIHHSSMQAPAIINALV